MQVLLTLTKPKLTMYHRLATDWECDHVIEAAKPHLKRTSSGVITRPDGTPVPDDTRKYYSALLEQKDVPVLRSWSSRVSTMIGFPVITPFRVFHYKEGDEMPLHFDRHFPSSPAGEMTTLLVYLSSCEGGATWFPRIGMSIMPTKRNGLLFSSTRDGKEDPLSLHAGMPITAGEKWLAATWFFRTY